MDARHARHALLAILLVAAGCAEPAELETPAPATSHDPPPSQAPPTTTPSQAPPPTTDVPDPAPALQNQPPVASLGANATRGTAPLRIAFTLEASDPDGDPLTVAFDANGDGLPEGAALGTVEALLSTPGTVTAVLVVSDGNATATSRLDITVDAPQQRIEAAWQAPASPAECLDGSALEPLDGLTHFIAEVDPATRGRPFNATFEAPAAYATVAFLDAERLELAAFDDPTATTVSGRVPEGAMLVALYACVGTAAVYASS